MADAHAARPPRGSLLLTLGLGLLGAACAVSEPGPRARLADAGVAPGQPFVVVLGTAQDGGLPQIGCRKECCAAARQDPSRRRLVTSLLAVDAGWERRFLLDASPHLPEQVELARAFGGPERVPGRPPLFDGILITHAHLGHYAGLAYLGREAYGSEETRVHGTPRLLDYLRTNGPWSLLFDAGHLSAHGLPLVKGPASHAVTPPWGEHGSLSRDGSPGSVVCRAMVVPHRGEFSDTVGFVLNGPSRSLLYIPDIDKWERWDVPIEDWIAVVDYALLDGTFFGPDELPGRPMGQIPHPFIVESMERFRALPATEKAKIHFTHLNHSNPAANPDSPEARQVRDAGFAILEEGRIFPL